MPTLQEAIARLGRNDPTLTALNLAFHNIDDAGAQALAARPIHARA